MESFINHLHAVDRLTEADKTFLRKHLTIVKLSRGDFFLHGGQVCNQIGFVTSGIVRVYLQDENGMEVTRYFLNEGHFAVDLNSFSNQTPAEEILEALTDVTLVVMTRPVMELFYKHIPTFSAIIRKLTERALLEKYKIKSEMISDSAPVRYNKLMERNPTLINRIPLHYISSYLGITASTLSRIRKDFR